MPFAAPAWSCRSISLLTLFFLFSIFHSNVLAQAPDLLISNFRCLESDGTPKTTSIGGNIWNYCQIGDRITVSVDKTSLGDWEKADETNTVDKLVVSLKGHLLSGNYASLSPNGNELTFVLQRNHAVASNVAAWKAILPRTVLYDAELMNISLALEGSSTRYAATDKQSIGIRVASVFRIITVVLLFGLLLFVFAILVVRRGLLRDSQSGVAQINGPFSLGRTQMAFWFILVVASFLYLWLVTGDYDVLTPGVLGLIGISATTSLLAFTIPEKKNPPPDNSKRRKLLQAEIDDLKTQFDEAVSQEAAMEAQRTTLQQKIDELNQRLSADPPPANADDLRTRATQAEAQLGDLTMKLDEHRLAVDLNELSRRRIEKETQLNELDGNSPRRPGRFQIFFDLVSSDGEVSLPRFQMVVWTLILGIIFLHSVFTTLNMPEFTATLLGLMGLSSGTYVGFKVPSKTDTNVQ